VRREDWKKGNIEGDEPKTSEKLHGHGHSNVVKKTPGAMQNAVRPITERAGNGGGGNKAGKEEDNPR